MRPYYFIYILIFLPLFSTAQESWLKASSSQAPFTSHRFYDGTYRGEYFYWWGDLWRDVIFDDFSASIPSDDDTHDAFLLQTDVIGNVQNLIHLSGSGYERVEGMTFGTDGTFWITGFFSEVLEMPGLSLSSTGFYDGFILQLQPDGSIVQAFHFPMDDFMGAINFRSIKMDQEGNLWVCANFAGSITLNETTYQGGFNQDGLVVKLKTNGEVLKVVQFDSDNSGEEGGFVDLTSLEIDAVGRVVVGGGMSGVVEVGDVIGDYGLGQCFVSVYDTEAEVDWMQVFTSGYSLINTITAIPGGGVIAGAQFQNSFDFGEETITGSGSFADMVVFALAEDGTPAWIKAFTKSSAAPTGGVYPISLDYQNGQIFLGGFYDGMVLYEGNVLLDHPDQQAYLMQFTAGEELPTAHAFEGGGYSRINAIAASPAGVGYAGEFAGGLVFQDFGVPGINSTLFYGLLSEMLSSNEEIQEDGLSISFHPNPASEYCYITSPLPGQLTIYNIDGKLIHAESLFSGVIRMDVSKWPAGNYVYRWESEGNVEVGQIHINR